MNLLCRSNFQELTDYRAYIFLDLHIIMVHPVKNGETNTPSNLGQQLRMLNRYHLIPGPMNDLHGTANITDHLVILESRDC